MRTYAEPEKIIHLSWQSETIERPQDHAPSTMAAHVLRLQRTVGNRAVQRMALSGRLPSKPCLGIHDNTATEEEAEQVAKQVMANAMPQSLQPKPIDDNVYGEIGLTPI
ncbi:MAG: hypothetical protein GC179_05475 [Anaerolineaceae bacterium]|nr:hypothetical protein [Anaerolineaceae bacterium]